MPSHRLATPTAAERAQTIAARGGKALIMLGAGHEPSKPLLHQIHTDGSCSILLPTDHAVVAQVALAPRGELSAMLELTDSAPVQLREPIRGLLWITGWLQALTPQQARANAVAIAAERPDPRLLDVGHNATMLVLTPASLVLADAEGSSSLAPKEFSNAAPDPFCLLEQEWLRHLEFSHRDVVDLLIQHIPPELHSGRIRPLGLDRWGLRLRVETEHGDHDVRLAFTHPVSSPRELTAELRKLVGCPFVTTAPRTASKDN